MDPRSDEQLLALMKGGDRAAFQQLVERYLNKIWRLAFNVLYDRQDAEDVTQEVFITVWDQRDKWQPGEASFSTWLYRVAVNRAIDFRRRRKPTADELDDSLPDSGDVPADERLASHEFRGLFKECLSALPEKQMLCLLLYYYEELNIPAICDRLNATEDGVRSLLKRGRANLKDVLRDRFGTDTWPI